MAGIWRRSKRNQYRHPVLIRMADKLKEILHGKSKLQGIMKQTGCVYS